MAPARLRRRHRHHYDDLNAGKVLEAPIGDDVMIRSPVDPLKGIAVAINQP
jgi:hypothetical protein